MQISTKSRFSQISTKISIFAHFDENRDFGTFRPNSRFSQKMTRFFVNFDQNGYVSKISNKIFSKISYKLTIFQNFDQNQDFSEISTKIEIFQYIVQNQICCKFRPKIEIIAKFRLNRDFRAFRPKVGFSQNLTKIEILAFFEKCRPKPRSTKIEIRKISTKIEIIGIST